METTLSLMELHTMMKDGKKLVDPDIFYNYQLGGFDGIAKTLLSGIEYNGTVLCEGFLQDGVLSDPEKEYLVRLSGTGSVTCIPVKKRSDQPGECP